MLVRRYLAGFLERLEESSPRVPVEFDIPRRLHRLPIAYDDHEQAALLTAAHALGPMYIVVVLLGIDGGLRRGEILGLQWSCIGPAESGRLVVDERMRCRWDDWSKGCYAAAWS